MNVETAHRHFLEVLLEARQDQPENPDEPGDPLLALALGLAFARRTDGEHHDADPLSQIFAALEDLILAVREAVGETTRLHVKAIPNYGLTAVEALTSSGAGPGADAGGAWPPGFAERPRTRGARGS